MTALCGGGASSAKPTSPAVVFFTGDTLGRVLIATLGLSEAWAELFAFVATQTISTTPFCSVDPPPITWPNAAQIAEFLANPFGAPPDAQAAVDSVLLNGIWLLLCQCNTGPQPTAPSVPAYPTTAPVIYPANPHVPGTNYAVQVFNDSPIHWWRMLEAPSPIMPDHGTTPVGMESSSPANTGFAFTGPDTGGGSFFILGSTDFNVGTTLQLTTPYSIELWFYSFSTVASTRELFAWDGASTHAINIWVSSTGILHYDSQTTGVGIVSASAVTNNVWHHVVVTHDGTTDQLYLDGNSIGTCTSVFSGTTGLTPYIGGRAETGVSFQGLISEVAVYGSVLSAGRVSAHYSAADLVTGTPTFIPQGPSQPTTPFPNTSIQVQNFQYLQQTQQLLLQLFKSSPATLTSLTQVAVHTGLLGDGSVLLQGSTVAVQVAITVDNPSLGSSDGDPPYLFDRGFIVPIALQGPIREIARLVHNPQLYLLPPLADSIGYSLHSGVMVTITEYARGS